MGTAMQVPVIAFDGSESVSGRALLCLSALYHCSDRLHGVKLRLIDVAEADVRLAAEALHWDVGLTIDVRPAGCAETSGCRTTRHSIRNCSPKPWWRRPDA
jgi:hypothetical protein